MAEGQRLHVKSCGLKGSLTKLTGKVEEALSAELETVSTESVPESRRVLVSTTVEQLKSKLAQITELDEAIAKTILEEEKLEAEICDADTYQSNLEQQIALLMEFIKKASQSPRSRPPTPSPSVNDAPHLISTESTTITNLKCQQLSCQRQNHKLVAIEAHMGALLNVLPPSNNLESLQTFYDTLQSHIRALSAVGESFQSYGVLLTTSVLRKLPPSVKMNMARDHYNTKWTIDELLLEY